MQQSPAVRKRAFVPAFRDLYSRDPHHNPYARHPEAVAVLQRLAAWAAVQTSGDQQRGTIQVGRRELMAQTGLSERKVRRALAMLEVRGELACVHRGTGQAPPVYAIVAFDQYCRIPERPTNAPQTPHPSPGYGRGCSGSVYLSAPQMPHKRDFVPLYTDKEKTSSSTTTTGVACARAGEPGGGGGGPQELRPSAWEDWAGLRALEESDEDFGSLWPSEDEHCSEGRTHPAVDHPAAPLAPQVALELAQPPATSPATAPEEATCLASEERPTRCVRSESTPAHGPGDVSEAPPLTNIASHETDGLEGTIDVQALGMLWNALAGEGVPKVLPSLLAQSERQTGALAEACRRHPDPAYWTALFELVRSSPFLQGKQRAWSPKSLAWVADDDNATKIIAGVYVDREALAAQERARRVQEDELAKLTAERAKAEQKEAALAAAREKAADVERRELEAKAGRAGRITLDRSWLRRPESD